MLPLAELFNPTFFLFLGILVLVVALMILYYESKMRDQNHKIASMLSLVSTLAEDMNIVKMGLNHVAMSQGQVGGSQKQSEDPLENNVLKKL
jgi:RecA/RadA recombinase